MKRENIRVAVLRIEGTNCEEESYLAWKRLGAASEKVHLKQLLGEDVTPRERRDIRDYHIFMIPGGFSAGDYIRAGAIFGARMKSGLREDLKNFVEEGKPVLGVCNGFQVLVEMGFLPAMDGTVSHIPEAILATNDSNRFECRPTLLRVEENRRCVFTRNYEEREIILFPCAHAEGKFTMESQEKLELLKQKEQVVFRYTGPEGENPVYPWNPNGAMDHIAGICNSKGNVLGLMPHPERVFYGITDPTWTRKGLDRSRGDGRPLFESALEYVEDNF